MLDPAFLAKAWPSLLGALVLGYALGSIPFGLIFTRLAGLGDIRQIGSGNIGATNVLRTGHKGIAAATLLADGLKGTLAVLIAMDWGVEAAILAGFGAFVGHCFTIWLGFRGGKGVATYLGVLAGLHWPTMLATILAWILTAALTRISSLAALLASLIAPLILFFFGYTAFALLFVVLTLILWIRHSANLRRLVRGEEHRFARAERPQ